MGDAAEARALGREQLEELAVAFGVLGRLFWEEPDAGVVDELAQARELLLAEPFATAAAHGAHELHDVLATYGRTDEVGRAESMAQLRQDRSFLFYQVSVSRTSPYESVYRTQDRTLFGLTTARVKADFARHGLVLDTGRNEPCDHFGLECAYLAQIAAAGAQSIGGDEDDGRCDDGEAHVACEGACAGRDQDVLAALVGATCELRRFLGEHVLVFAPIYLGHVERQARSTLYRAAAVLAREVLVWAADMLGARPAERLDPADFPLKPRPCA